MCTGYTCAHVQLLLLETIRCLAQVPLKDGDRIALQRDHSESVLEFRFDLTNSILKAF